MAGINLPTGGAFMIGNTSVVSNGTYYVSTTGSDSNSGTISSPFLTIAHAYSLANPGDVIFVRGGTYTIAAGISQGISLTGKNGTAGNLIKVWNYPGETPVIDCINMLNGYNGLSGIEFAGNYVHIKGFEVKNIQQPLDASSHGIYCVGFSITNANNCIFENINSHHHGAIGMNLGLSCTNNLILNCDCHHNYDPYTWLHGVSSPGGNADGFHITLTNSTANNIFKGCRSWWNSDDGYDTFNTEGYVTFDTCWSFWNGYLPGTFTPAQDGMGFKLGQTTAANDGLFHRIMQNCVSFQNKQHGVDKSDLTQCAKLINNSVYYNGGAGISLNNTYVNYVRNNMIYHHGTNIYIGANCVYDHNTTNGLVTVTDGDFVSVDSTGMDGARKSNGELPSLNFLKLASGSDLINAGIDIGLYYIGSAPDMGAYEFYH